MSGMHVDRPGGHNLNVLQNISGTALLQDVLLAAGVSEGLGGREHGGGARQQGGRGAFAIRHVWTALGG